MVSQHSPEQEEFFPGAEAAVYFKDARDAAERITALLTNETQRNRLRARASEIVRDHTYVERAQTLLASVVGKLEKCSSPVTS